MEMTVEMMQELINSGIISIEDVEKAKRRKIQEALMKEDVKTPKITKRGEKKFICNIPRRYSLDGKIHQVVGESEEDCAKKFEDAVYAFITGQYDKNRTFDEICIEYLNKKNGSVCATTMDQYSALFRNHIQGSAFGTMKMQEIKLPECENFIKTLYNKSLSFGSIKLIKTVTCGVFDYAVCHNYITTNYMSHVKVNPNVCNTDRERRHEAWTDEELVQIKEHSLTQWNEKKKYRHSALIMVMAFTGCRIGELLAARWEDVDLENKTFRINKNLVMYKDYNTNRRVMGINNVKTMSGRRTIQLTDEAVFWFKEIRERSRQAGVLNEYVVVGRNGKILDQSHIDVRIKTFCDAVGITYKPAHSCRRSYATIMIDGGIPISEVSADLGHKNISTTQNIYYKRRADVTKMTNKKNLAILATVGNRSENPETRKIAE